MESRCQYFIEILWLLVNSYLRPNESDCSRFLSKDTTTVRVRRLANYRDPPPWLVKPALQEDGEFFEKLPHVCKYSKDLLVATRDFPSCPQAGWRFSVPATLSHRRTNRPVNGRVHSQ